MLCNRTKAALIREPGYPIGTPAPMYLNCECGHKVKMPADVAEVSCGNCGIRYDARGNVLPQRLEPIAEIAEFVAKRDAGICCLITEELFDYFLGAIPPVFMNERVTLIDGRERYASFGFAEGCERITAFWCANGSFFAQHTNRINRL